MSVSELLDPLQIVAGDAEAEVGDVDNVLTVTNCEAQVVVLHVPL